MSDGKDVGGDFVTTKSWAVCPSGQPVSIDTGWIQSGLFDERRYLFEGPLIINEMAIPSSTPFPAQVASSDATLNAWGAKAIARCAPTEPTVSLAASLLEAYRDGLPKLIGRSTWQERVRKAQTLRKNAGTASDEFLNVEFGWLPLISDVRDFTSTVIHLHKLLQQYMRDNGRVVRRRFSFPPEISYVESVISTNQFPRAGINGSPIFDSTKSPRGIVVRRRSTTVYRWFSGAFVYHLPQSFFASMYTPFAADFQTAQKLFGLELTPDVLWQLTPWSWAVDWFSNVGDVIHNASAWANDGLVMKYGYIMEHSRVQDTYTYTGPTNIRGGSAARPPDLTLVSETKKRKAANPFGFGLTMSGLSPVQKSILAAVGFSRLK